ncbi:MAG: NAD(P)H-hydrate epimerase [Bacteroidota bacterium]
MALMREIDRIAMEETGPNLFQMMENAGRNLAETAMAMLGREWSGMQTVVLAGTGGNGGGGICAARHLANRGVDVRLALTSVENLREVPAYQRSIYLSTGEKEVGHRQLMSLRPDLVIDAVIGYSLDAAPRGAALDLIRWAQECGAPILSLDIPSGTDATTGESRGEFIRADRTLSLALPKTGLASAPTGDLFLGDLGIPAAAFTRAGVDYSSPFDERYVIPIFRSG